MKTELIDGEIPATIREEWSGLLNRAAEYSGCQTPIYCGVALSLAKERGHAIHHIVARNGDGRLVGIWPLTAVTEAGLRIIRPATSCSNEEYSIPLVDADGADDIYEAILAKAAAMRGDILQLYNVAGGSVLESVLCRPAFARLKPVTHRIESYSRALRKYPTWDDYLANSSGSHRKGLRNDLNRLKKLGKVEVGQCQTPAQAEETLREAFAEKRRWAAARNDHVSWLDGDTALHFWVRLAENTDLKTCPLVSFLKLDGQVIAAQINLIGRPSYEVWFTVYDPAYARYSPGQILFEETIKEAWKRGLDFDLRIIHAPYKEKICDTVTPHTSCKFLLTTRARFLDPVHAKGKKLSSRAKRSLRRVRSKLMLKRRYYYFLHKWGDRRLGIRTLDTMNMRPGHRGESWYEPIPYAALKAIDRQISLGEDDVFFDIGAGMGTALCYFARQRLKEVIGVELDKELSVRAFSNIQAMKGRKCGPISILTGDAREMDYRKGTVFFLYNPFDGEVMGATLINIMRSVLMKPRPIKIIYANPEQEAVFDDVNQRNLPSFMKLAVRKRFTVPYFGQRMNVIIYDAHAPANWRELQHENFRMAAE